MNLPSFPIKIWGKSVQGFLSYDRSNKQIDRPLHEPSQNNMWFICIYSNMWFICIYSNMWFFMHLLEHVIYMHLLEQTVWITDGKNERFKIVRTNLKTIFFLLNKRIFQKILTRTIHLFTKRTIFSNKLFIKNEQSIYWTKNLTERTILMKDRVLRKRTK